MVRGNWQKRVEFADARRKASRQRKQRSQNVKQYKAYFVELLQMLDRHGRRPLVLHLWTDSIASDSPPWLDVIENANEESWSASKRRLRASSVTEEGEEDEMTRNKGRARSNSLSENKTKKKAHPRSKQQQQHDLEEQSPADVRLLCRLHFFHNRCSAKKNACRHLHYAEPYQTLATVLNKTVVDKHQVELSEQALDEQTDVSAMEMVYYLCIDLKEDESSSCSSISDEIADRLTKRGIPFASVVYVATEKALLFDRNRDGVIVNNDRELLFLLAGSDAAAGSRRISIGSEEDGSVDESLFNLPGSILEHMLTFLPDPSVAAASQVCKAWNHEIGQHSPNLWKNMLERRHWPLPTGAGVENTTSLDQQALYRNAFLMHYSAMRDVAAIKAGLAAIVSKRAVEEKEMAYQDFSTRKHAPSEPNCCVSVQVWSPKRVLAAYSRDCSLRLFETATRSGGEDLLCRELVCLRIDPYRNTKRRNCHIVSMGLDEESIGCLCHVTSDSVEAEAYVLVVVSRDDFLLGESSAAADAGSLPDGTNLHVIDIGEAVLNFLLSSDVVDHRLLHLMDFLSTGGEIGEVEVLVSQSIAACGYGRFLVEVSLSIPSLDAEAEGESAMQLLDRKLVLFSTNAGAIVWMGESNDLSQSLRPRHEDMVLSTVRRTNPGASRSVCSFLVGSSTSPSLLLGTVEPSGEVLDARPIGGTEDVRNEIAENGWVFSSLDHRAMTITSSCIIAVDVLKSEEDNEQTKHKSVVSFYTRYPAVEEPIYSTLVVGGDIEVLRMVVLRNEHVVLLCREKMSDTNTAVVAVVVHIATRQEIDRRTLVDLVGNDMNEIPEISIDNSETIGACLSWKGVCMTGRDIRSMIKTTEASEKLSAKKKKKRNVGKKKDGFARGMSLRG